MPGRMGNLNTEIENTVLAMRRAIAGQQEPPSSDEPYLQLSNRGNKLKRKAYQMQTGHDGKISSPKLYRTPIEHGGYRRNILLRNPKRYDQDGEELDSSDEDEEADIQVAAENPYSDIKLEALLRPLVSAAELPEHPSMSSIYTSSILSDMAQQASEMVQKERKSLANAKHLLTSFRGDGGWNPCGQFCGPADEKIFDTSHLFPDAASTKPSLNLNGFEHEGFVNGSVINDFTIMDSETGDHIEFTQEMANEVFNEPQAHVKLFAKRGETENVATKNQGNPSKSSILQMTEEEEERYQNELVAIVGDNLSASRGTDLKKKSDESARNASEDQAEPAASVTASTNEPESRENDQDEVMEDQIDPRAAPRRMRTRAQAQNTSDVNISTRADTPESSVIPDIHPLFMIPESAVGDMDHGLPPNEAEETRRLLRAYVQKQEEVVRHTEKLYNGLTEAELARKEVFKACKAEGHLGEMSDGEDWYDKDEWGLESDLVKGRDEDIEDKEPPGKKTRGRRA